MLDDLYHVLIESGYQVRIPGHAQLQPNDIVFFLGPDGSRVHVGIVINPQSNIIEHKYWTGIFQGPIKNVIEYYKTYPKIEISGMQLLRPPKMV